MLSEKTRERSLCLFLLFAIAYATGYAQETDEYLLWAKVSDFPENSGAIVNQSDLDADGNLYVIGSYYKSFPWDQDPTQTISMLQIFLRKYDTNGNLLWSQEFGTDKNYSYGTDIRVDRQGDIVFAGYLYDLEGTVFGQAVPGFFLAKMDSGGSLRWIQSLSNTSLWTWGERIGTLCKQSKLEIDLDNSIVIYSNGNPAGSPRTPTSGLYINRYSTTGNLTHQYQITHDDNFDSPGIGGLAIDKDGSFIITGYFHNSLQIGTEILGIPGSQSPAPVHLFIAKFSSTGIFLWVKEAEGTSIGSDVDVDKFGNIYLTGIAPGHATLGGSIEINSSDFFSGFIARLDFNGNTVWSNVIVGGHPISLKRTNMGDLYISGTCNNYLTYDQYKIMRTGLEESFVLKINSDASFGAALVSDGVPRGVSYRIAYNSSIDDAGNIYTIGNFSDEIVFGCDTLRSAGDEMFITKYSHLPPVYLLPVIGLDNVCDGEALILSTSPVPEPVKYFWTAPPGVFITYQEANHITMSVPAAADGGEVSVAIRKGCYNYQTDNPYKISMKFAPEPVIVSGQSVYCNGGEVRFNSTTSIHATSYVWELPIGITSKQNTLVTIEPYIDTIISSEFDKGTVTAKSRNECFTGEPSEGFMIQMIKAPPPIAFINTKDEFCNRGQKEIFEVTKSDLASEYVWKVPSMMNETGTITTPNSHIQLTLKNEGSGLLSVYARNVCHQTEEISYPIKLTNPLIGPEILKSRCDLELTTDGTENIEWFRDARKFDEGVQTISLSLDGEYYVTVSNYCGTVASAIVAANPLVDEKLFIPNVITPNNDRENDLFSIKPGMDELSLEIFNRWGKSVYNNSNYKNEWDGSGLEEGVYFFQMQHACLKQQYKGWLQIIR